MEKESYRVRPIPPGWLIPITLAAGLVTSGPLAGTILVQCGYRRRGWITGIFLSLAGIGLLAGMFLWSVEWYWTTMTLLSLHLLCGIALFFGVRRPYQQFQADFPLSARQHGTYREVIIGIVSGTFLSGLFGLITMIGYVLAIDWLFSTVMPVAAEDELALARVFSGVAFIMLSGALAGGSLAWVKRRVAPRQLIAYSLGLLWCAVTWNFMLEGAIAIPVFQAGAATGQGWDTVMMAFSQCQLLVGVWWTVWLLTFLMAPVGISPKLIRAIYVLGMNAVAAITLSILLGYPADLFLALGRNWERNALTQRALWCYERGLSREPQPAIASYLQYRVALLQHKLGNTSKAIQGFKRMVAKYNQNKELTKQANHFLDNLARTTTPKRMVLPGVETRTEYKGGYCVPNSLALAMRYWGSNVTARTIGKRITGLGSGTFEVNQRWFAEQEGFRHDFLPMATLEDIKRCIDAGFPVLVYVPSHVFAIVGYDEGLDTFVTYDVATNDVWVEYLQKDFIKAWKKRATTLVLAYPPEKETLIPEDIRSRLARLSDNYLHFQLQFLDAPTDGVSVPHLTKAAGDTGELFFPVTILYNDYPGLRANLNAQYAPQTIETAITTYFGEDFDEGVHLWGQYHNERWPWPDWALRYSIYYLIGQQRFETVARLLTRIDEQGQLSPDMLAEVGMIELAQGHFASGLDRLNTSNESLNPLYAGLAYLKTGNEQSAIRELLNAVTEASRNKRLDEYGFPRTALAHHILTTKTDYGESKEAVEAYWEKWTSDYPYDAPVAAALAKIYEQQLVNVNQAKEPAVYQRIERKLTLARSRASRYNLADFAQ